MKRRLFLKGAITLPVFSLGTSSLFASLFAPAPLTPIKRVRPGDAGWPSAASWEQLNKQVNGRIQYSWQQSFWGANYAKLLTIKKKYDSNGMFFVHHGVGSETWSKDGFTKL
jgi:hypothetical protein